MLPLIELGDINKIIQIKGYQFRMTFHVMKITNMTGSAATTGILHVRQGPSQHSTFHRRAVSLSLREKKRLVTFYIH